jgi:hypothetical protein
VFHHLTVERSRGLPSMFAHCVFKCRMPDIENRTSEAFHDFLFVTALCLIVAIVLFVLGTVLSSWTFSGASLRDRLELISEQSSNVVTTGFVLAAVICLFQVPPERAPQFRPVVIATLIVGGLFTILSLYAIGDVLTRHISTGDASGSISFGLGQGATLRARLGAALPQAGSLLIAVLATFGANRIGGFYVRSGTHAPSDDFPDLPEVE